MKRSEYYRIGDFSVEISDTLFCEHIALQKHLLPFRITKREELSEYVSGEPDFRILDRRHSEGSRSFSGEGILFFEEQECATPTRCYLMTDGAYMCEMLSPEMNRILLFHITADWSEIALCYDDSDNDPSLLFIKIGVLFSVALLSRDACVFHGVAMDYSSKGILVMAASGVGKSTHTDRWESMKLADIINGDRCLCRKLDQEWFVYGMPWAGSSEKYLQKKARVHWIVDIKRGEENRVERLSPFEKEIFLLQRIFAPVSQGALQERAFQIVHEIADQANVIGFRCLPDEASVITLKACIDQEEKQNACK